MEMFLKVVIVTWVIFSTLTQVECGCRMTGNEYQAGDVWHPRLQNANSNYCVTCRCVMDEQGRFDYDCTSEQCPEGCSGGPDQGECCSICSAPASGTSIASSGGSPSPGTSNGGGSGGSIGREGGQVKASPSHGDMIDGAAPWRVCVVSGTMYNHGDTFSSNYSDALNDKCQNCFCNDGVTHCSTKTCPAVTCPSPIYTRRDCCRVCRDTSLELDWETMVSFSDPSPPKGSANLDCKIGGRYFVNGSVWHPVIGPFGEMDCVLCRCYNGRIDCSRLKCQSRDKLHCAMPVKVAGQCCPVCPLKLLISGPTPSAGDTVRCLSERTQQAVWLNNGAGNNTGVLHYVFEPVEGSSSVLHLHRMIIKSRNLENLAIYDISREEFKDLRSTYTFTLLGGTTTRLMNKFKKREQRVERKCKKKGRCTLQLEAMEKTLKVKPPQARVRCARGEREI